MGLLDVFNDPTKKDALKNFSGLLGDLSAGFTQAAQNNQGLMAGFSNAGQMINKSRDAREDREMRKLMLAMQVKNAFGPKAEWQSVEDPMFGKGQRNMMTGEFKPVKAEGSDPTKANEAKQAALDVTNRLLNNVDGVKANRGGISTLFPNVRDSSVNAEADLETLGSLLTTENLGLLKGVLSDTDMKILKDIGAGGLKGADSQVISNLRTIQAKLSGQLGAPMRPAMAPTSSPVNNDPLGIR